LYIPKFNEENDTSVLHSFIKAKPLGAWVVVSEGEINVNHIPFVLHEKKGEFGTLVGHVARANPVWSCFSEEFESVIIFQGEHAYITPSWYASKREHGKAVPTWNYTVVHAYGNPIIIEDREWLLGHINEMTDIHEAGQEYPWRVSDAPDEFIERLLGAIIGVEIPINRLKGKVKIGQNRSEPDKRGMIAGLTAKADTQAQGLAKMINEYIHGK
jgi:transcriptional regulator